MAGYRTYRGLSNAPPVPTRWWRAALDCWSLNTLLRGFQELRFMGGEAPRPAPLEH
ncbi:MAG: hypothetical protein Q9P01_05270 [Anaerolineae bacterium]|nr:hypothetical protein [Anaerolineae bacterium]